MSRLRVKICGLTEAADARVVAEAGGDVIGCVLVPSSPRFVRPERAAELREASRLPLALVVADLPLAALASAAAVSGASILQLHGSEDAGYVAEARAATGARIWKGVRVREGSDVARAMEEYGSEVDAILLDGWHPGQLGGTGVAFPWEDIVPFRETWPADVAFGVAGGLSPDNVGTAIRLLSPDVVDVSSGVERSPGRKDPDRIRSFVAESRFASEEGR